MEFKDFGGQFVAGKILDAVKEIETAYNFYKNDQLFLIEYHNLLKTYVGRPSLLYYAKNMTEDLGGAKIYLKREDLNHTGSHKLNNVIGQALLAKKMGKKKLIAETGAGQHGVATATVAALFNMECEIYMGKVDCEKQALNVYKMELLGAKVVQVTNGTQSLKEAVDAALVAWANHLDDTYYLIGSVVGPHPFPTMVRDFQKVIGQEIKQQINEVEGRNPDMVIACVGGGSNAMGAFYEFVNDKDVMLVGVEASGKGLDTNEHAATLTKGQIGVIHGMKTKVLINERGEIAETHSISSGLDYPGVGPEHAFLESIARVKYVSAADNEALEAFTYLSRVEGIIPALESAHALAEGIKQAKRLSKDKIIVINLSGRGDKDIDYISKYVKVK
ncbi:MAG: tryptophan synthase subunit beta [Erysipelotrichaceae bacterium]|jgi:tryptophan synthase beta chain|nr:tryptophan synthase subunit beta [Erysipelotrichaceae bacterium]